MLHSVIFAPFSFVFFRKMGRGPLQWAFQHCAFPRRVAEQKDVLLKG